MKIDLIPVYSVPFKKVPAGGILSASGRDSKCQWGGGILSASGGDSKCQWGGF